MRSHFVALSFRPCLRGDEGTIVEVIGNQEWTLCNLLFLQGNKIISYTVFYKKLVDDKKLLVLRRPKFYETVLPNLRSIKELLKVKSMDVIANMSLILYS